MSKRRFADSVHDHRRLAWVAPPDWRNPPPKAKYHLVVVGAGSAGLVTAAGAAGLGAKVALVERHRMGGDCLNTGCVPSKGLIRAARAVAAVRAAARFGVQVGDVHVDFAAAAERMRAIRADLAAVDSAERFRHLGVDVFLGNAKLTERGTVDVGDVELRGHRIVLATGSSPLLPPIAGLAEAGYLTNESVFDLADPPRRLIVIGGGPIGCELAQAFARLGSDVTLVEQGTRILPREDADVSLLVAAALARDGVRVLTDAKAQRAGREGAGRSLTVVHGGKEATLVADEILVAVGRRPNLEGLGLDAAGVAYSPHGVIVDARLRTSHPRIYAIGDLALPYQFTHMADASARLVIANALFAGRGRWTDLVVPWVTYTDPEVAHVGATRSDLEARDIDIDEYRIPLHEVDRARLDGEDEGYLSVLTPRGKDRILGATLVASHAGEMLGELTLAIQAGLGLKTIAKVIHPYPTQAEVMRKAGDAYNRTRLTPLAAKLIRTWLRLWA